MEKINIKSGNRNVKASDLIVVSVAIFIMLLPFIANFAWPDSVVTKTLFRNYGVIIYYGVIFSFSYGYAHIVLSKKNENKNT
jgi:hypothetical protein